MRVAINKSLHNHHHHHKNNNYNLRLNSGMTLFQAIVLGGKTLWLTFFNSYIIFLRHWCWQDSAHSNCEFANLFWPSDKWIWFRDIRLNLSRSIGQITSLGYSRKSYFFWPSNVLHSWEKYRSLCLWRYEAINLPLFH